LSEGSYIFRMNNIIDALDRKMSSYFTESEKIEELA
jgi:hypothetical protein